MTRLGAVVSDSDDELNDNKADSDDDDGEPLASAAIQHPSSRLSASGMTVAEASTIHRDATRIRP
jgi:hypothetical protein